MKHYEILKIELFLLEQADVLTQSFENGEHVDIGQEGIFGDGGANYD